MTDFQEEHHDSSEKAKETAAGGMRYYERSTEIIALYWQSWYYGHWENPSERGSDDSDDRNTNFRIRKNI